MVCGGRGANRAAIRTTRRRVGAWVWAWDAAVGLLVGGSAVWRVFPGARSLDTAWRAVPETGYLSGFMVAAVLAGGGLTAGRGEVGRGRFRAGR